MNNSIKLCRYYRKKFGKLTVKERVFIRLYRKKKIFGYLCECECGNVKITTKHNLTEKSSCFHGPCNSQFVDLTGKMFGNLKVISYLKNENKNTYWNCECKCGKMVQTTSNNLKSKDITSCGATQCKTYFIDMSGVIINNITVIDFYGRENGITYWNCKCVCGSLFKIAQSN